MVKLLINETVDTSLFIGGAYLYSQQAKVSPELTLSIAAISRVAHFIIQQAALFAVYQNNHTREEREYTYLCVSLTIDVVSILALRYFNLIGRTGMIVLSSLAVIYIKDFLNGNLSD